MTVFTDSVVLTDLIMQYGGECTFNIQNFFVFDSIADINMH